MDALVMISSQERFISRSSRSSRSLLAGAFLRLSRLNRIVHREVLESGRQTGMGDLRAGESATVPHARWLKAGFAARSESSSLTCRISVAERFWKNCLSARTWRR